MDYELEHWINGVVREHGLLGAVVEGFATWGVVAFAGAVALLWLFDAPGVPPRLRRACATGLAAAGLGLLGSQVVSHLWERARPSEAHPGSILPVLTPSTDPSFPSDHATAAFAIAVGVLLVARRAGLFLLAWAVLIGLSRVLAGVHYPGDVLAGAVLGTAGALVAVRLGALLDPAVRLAAALTDPVLRRARERRWVAATAGSATVRQLAVAAAGTLLLVVFAVRLDGHLVDELPLASLAAWAAAVAVLVRAVGATGERAVGATPPAR